MNLKMISQVSRHDTISTRILRYFNKIGLLPSLKKNEYDYHAFDQADIVRLGQITILEKQQCNRG